MQLKRRNLIKIALIDPAKRINGKEDFEKFEEKFNFFLFTKIFQICFLKFVVK